jgi:hypothetical protein
VSLDNPDEKMIPSRLKGNSQMAPKEPAVNNNRKIAANPLAIPLKVPGIG